MKRFDENDSQCLQKIILVRRDIRGKRFKNQKLYASYKFIAYLTVDYVTDFLDEQELLKVGRQEKKELKEIKII